MNKTIQTIAIVVGLLAAVCTAHCQITVAAVAGLGQRNVLTSAGVPADGRATVHVGFFQEGFDPYLNSNDPVSLSTAWVELASTDVRIILGEPGRFAAQWTVYDPTFSVRQLWFFIISSDNNEYGLFSSTSPDWVTYDISDPPPFAFHLLTTDAINIVAHGLSGPGSLYLGTRCTAPRGEARPPRHR